MVGNDGMKGNEEIKLLFNALGHVAAGGVTDVRAIGADGRGGEILRGFFDNEEALVAEAARANALGYNLYFGISARAPGLFERAPNRLVAGVTGGGSDDVVPPILLLIDLDVDTPRRRAAKGPLPGSKAAATDEEIPVVAAAASAVMADPLLIGVTPGKTFSGNGFGILVPILTAPDANLDHIGAQMKAFGDLIRTRHRYPGSKIDSTFDLARISALPATMKRKGADASLHRMVELLQVPQGALDLSLLAEPTDVKVRVRPGDPVVRLDPADATRLPTIPSDSEVQALLDQVGRRCPALRRILDDVQAHPTEGRSGLLYHLTGLLGNLGLCREDVANLVLWHDDRCGQKFVRRRYPGWHDYLASLLDRTGGYQGNRTTIRRLLGESACSGCDAHSCG